jgi:hypothetical protein
MVQILNLYETVIRANVDALRFRLIFDPTARDQYAPADDNAITITGNQDFANLITSPVLTNAFGELVGVSTQWIQMPVSSNLKHEFGHYLRIGLEGIVNDAAFLAIGPALFAHGISGDYLAHLADIWDDSEELTEIFSIAFVNGQLVYDRLNQSDFNMLGGVLCRYSHRNSAFPVVPYRLFDISFGGEEELCCLL